ncbi:MAG: spermidine synthase [Myxococcales bacterium]|jgi:spermidine synthase
MRRLLPYPLTLLFASGSLTVSGALAASPKTLFEKRSDFNHIIIQEEGGLRSLIFAPGGAIQSTVRPGKPLDLELSYTRSAMIALAAVPNPKSALVVGLGGGAMPMFLRALYPEMRIDAVDIDPAVVEVARQYFGFREDDKMRAHAGDGRAFVEKSTEAYDLIFLDAYGPSSIPMHLATLEFLFAVRARLSPRGVVAGNVWSPESNRHYWSMRRTYEEAMGNLCVYEVPEAGNRIFLASAGELPPTAKLVEEASRLQRAKKLPFDLAALAQPGCSKETVRGAELLRDPPKAR